MRTLAPLTQGSPRAPTSEVYESELSAEVLEGKLSSCTQMRQPKDPQFAGAPPALCCLPPKKHLALIWKENDLRAIKQYNICACINKNLDSLRMAMLGSLMQRCVAIVVLPMGARSRKTRSIDLASELQPALCRQGRTARRVTLSGLRSSAVLQRGVFADRQKPGVRPIIRLDDHR